MSKLEKIRQLVGRSKLKRAVKELKSLGLEDEENMLIGLESRVSTLQTGEMMGTMTAENAGVERRSITAAILSFISMIEEDYEEEKEEEKPAPKPEPVLAGGAIKVADQEGLEKVIGKNGLTSISWLTEGVERAKSVCKIHTSEGYVGTGFLIEGGYIFTNNHVIPTSSAAQFAQLEFGYDNPTTNSAYYDLDHMDFKTSVDLDYTRIKVIDNPDKPLSQWGVLPISPIAPQPDDPLVIIQHPQGRPKEIAFRDGGNSIWEHRLHYQVSTEPGSSGSPVFDINWNVVALHHAGGRLPVNADGYQQNVNEGILFKFIETHLRAQEAVGANESVKGVSPTAPSRGGISKPIKTLLVYHLNDANYADQLFSHMFSHIRSRSLEIFDIHKDVPTGAKFEDTIQQQLEQSNIILVMISANLYRRDFYKTALAVEDCIPIPDKSVVPILVSPFDLKGTPFEGLSALPPKDAKGKAITDFPNLDKTLMKISEGLYPVISHLAGS